MRRETGCPSRRPHHRPLAVVPEFPTTPGEARHYGLDAIAYVAIASAVLSATVGAYSAYSASQAQSGALQYNAALQYQQAAYQQQLGEFEATLIERQAAGSLSMAEAEQAMAEQQAKAAQTAGDIREAGIRRAYGRNQSEVAAAIGKSGVDTTGSPLLVLLENADTVGQQLGINDYQTALDVAGAKAGGAFAAAEGHMRADALMSEAKLRRFGAMAGASASIGQAGMLNMQAGSVRSAGYLNVGTSLLGGVSSATSPFLRYGGYGSTPRGGYNSGMPAFP